MSNFEYTKMMESEELVNKALAAKNGRDAFYYSCLVGQYAALLAKRCEKTIARKHLMTGKSYLELAEKIRKMYCVDGTWKNEAAAVTRQPESEGNQPVKAPDQEGETVFHAMKADPSFNFSCIAGMEDVKAVFREQVINPMFNPENAKKWGLQRSRGVLMYGPPGVGKTYIAKALAGELNASYFLVIKSSDLVSKWVGDTEKNIASLFKEARSHKHAVIFIDELDALTVSRADEGTQSHERSMVAALLQELDGIMSKDSENALLFLGATNRPYSVDTAFLRPKRLDKWIYTGLPDLPARREILRMFFEKRQIAVPDQLLDEAAEKTDGYNAADVDAVAQEVVTIAFNKEVDAKTRGETIEPDFPAYFAAALESVKSSVSQRDIELIRGWEKEMAEKKA